MTKDKAKQRPKDKVREKAAKAKAKAKDEARAEAKPGRDTLALVESPAQLLNVIEWASHAKAQRETRVAVLPPRDPAGRVQLASMAALAKADGLAVSWYEPRSSPAALVQVAWELFPRLAKATRLVIGDPFSRFVQAILPLADVDRVVVVDDGTATISFVNQLVRGEQLVRWHLPESGRGVVREVFADQARRYFVPSPAEGRSVDLFTAMPVAAPEGVGLAINGFEWTRDRFGPPEVTDSVDLLGTSLVETGVIGLEVYLKGVASLTAEHGAGRYFAHRRESDDKLRQIAQVTGLKVVRPDVPLEVAVRRGPVSRLIVSFPSTVTHTLPLVLEGTGVTLAICDVPTSWMTPSAPGGAADFLAGMTASARDRHGLRPAG
jgi:hypothetical protein